MTRRSTPLLAVGVVLSLLGPLRAVAATAAGVRERDPPNIVLVVTDDQRWDTLSFMPNVQHLIEHGRVFPNAFVPDPLCCPSRTSILTGNYSHTTGVYTNRGHGGFRAFHDRRTIATALTPTYRTGLVGKYLNGFPDEDYRYVPPGWDSWVVIGGGRYYDYDLAINGRRSRHFGTSADEYSGRVLTERALAFVTRPSDRPFFLLFAPVAPHAAVGTGIPIPDPMDDGMLDGTIFEHPPSYNEMDVTDKPPFIQQTATEDLPLLPQKQIEALLGVDRSIGLLLDAVPDNTLVILTSDNGFLLGEHRWRGKNVPYNESIRVPLVLRCVRCRLVEPASEDPRFALNIDFAATILDAAGLPRDTPTAIDVTTREPVAPAGRSLLRDRWVRTAFVLEHVGRLDKVPSFCGVRSADHLFVHYADGFEEVYDEQADPWEMDNIAGEEAAPTDALRAQAVALCDPVPPGFTWPVEHASVTPPDEGSLGSRGCSSRPERSTSWGCR